MVLMTAKNKVEVRIAGKEYTLVGTESDEYMHKIALYVDKKMAEIQNHNKKLSTNAVAVLTSINITDELIKAKEMIAKLEAELVELKRELERYCNENAKLLEENAQLTRKNTSLQMDLVKKEAELNETRNVLDRSVR